MSRSARYALAAALCALAAAWMSLSYTGSARRGLGPERNVLVAARGFERGADGDAVAGSTTLRRVPARFAPVGALTDRADLTGRRLLVPVRAGEYLTNALLSAGDEGTATGYHLRSGERALSVDAIVAPFGLELAGGERVDLYASGFGGSQTTEQLISGAEVLAAETAGGAARARLTLRLAGRQVAIVVRADVFARELRAVVRPESQ